MTTLSETFNELKKRFDKDAAKDFNMIFQFDVTDGQTYHMHINHGTLDIYEGAHDDPSVTFIMDAETITRVMDGSIDGMQAFMQGKLRAEGDVMLATKLADFFN